MDQDNLNNNLPDNAGESKVERDERGRVLPGCSLNPAGKPRGTLSLISILKRLLQNPIPGSEVSYAEGIVTALLDKSLSGDIKAITTIINYIDGLPKQTFVIEKEEDDYKCSNTIADLIRKQSPEDRQKSIDVFEKLLGLADDKEIDNLTNNN